MNATDPPDPGEPSIGPEEGDEILALMAEMQAEPVPPDLRPVGCLGAVLALAILLALPWVAPSLEMGAGSGRMVAVVLVLVLLAGAFLGVFGGGFVSGHIRGQVEDALALLEARQTDLPRDELRRAAVRILWDGHISVGPTTFEAFDAREAAPRLGDALPYVQEVERFLLERDLIYPIFTEPEQGPGPPGDG